MLHSVTSSAHVGVRAAPQRQPTSRPVAARRAVLPTPGARSRVGVVVCRAQKVDELPASLKKIVGAFQMVPDPMARYKQLLFYATKLEPLPAEDHIPQNKVEGCVSQVWVAPQLRNDGKVYWTADSDSQLTKGLAALLVQGLSGCTPAEILSLQPSFIEMLGLKQSLTPSRNNGFLNMFRLMQRKTLELVAAAAAAAQPSEASSAASTNGHDTASTSTSTSGSVSSITSNATVESTATSGPADEAASASRTPIQDGIRRKLTEVLRPSRLTILDESSQHAGHAAMMTARPGKAGGPGETHFKVEVVSEVFEGMTLVKRQRMIYQLLDQEFALGLHALSLITRTPAEAEKVAA